MDRFRQLLNACENGETHVVQNLLEQGVVQVDDVDEDETTALQMAAANGQEQVVRLLLMKGAALDKANMAGWTPLMQSCRHGHTNVVALLLQNKADINALNRLGASALTIASRGGHLQIVRLLLDSGAESNRQGKDCEITPLMSAAQNGHDSVLRLLLDRGYEVNYQTPSNGLTPLMAAAQNGHMTTAQVLIERGGDPNLTDINNRTALEIATIRGKREVRGYLDRKTTNKPKISPEEVKPDIIDAAKHGDLERINKIVKEDRMQVNACSPQDGATPLMFAAMMGRLDIVRYLVDKGCDINMQDTISGWTALMQATYHGQKSVALFLVNDAKAEVTLQAKNGCTAFDMASLLDDVDTELLRLLAEKTMKVNQRQGKGKKPLVKQNGSTPDYSDDDDPSRNGLKAWWSRMSNRFRNLKLGRTNGSPHFATVHFTYDSEQEHQKLPDIPIVDQRLPAAPIQSQQIIDFNSYETMLQETKRSATMCTQDSSPAHSNTCETLKPVVPPFLPPPTFGLDTSDASHRRPCSGRRTAPVSPVLTNSNLSSGRWVAGPSKFVHNRSMGNLSVHQVNSQSPAALPTYLPPASSLGVSGTASSSNPSISGYKKCFQPSTPSTNYSNITSVVSSSVDTPGATVAPSYAVGTRLGIGAGGGSLVASPSSRTGTGSVVGGSVGTPEHVGSESNLLGTVDYHQLDLNLIWSKYVSNRPTYTPTQRLYSNKLPVGLSALRNASNTTSPDSSTSGSSSMTPHRSSHGRSTSTLTPSASPTPGKTEEEACADYDKKNVGSEDEISGILRKLSLERYHPIFEEQEVDMEAFLTLTDRDLKELGISHNESRRQILAAITELETGKGRERQQFHETLASFQKARNLSETGNIHPLKY